MRRLYDQVVTHHHQKYNQMLFLAGPRQVGKTTITRNCQAEFSNSHYLNWDIQTDRHLITAGAKALNTYVQQHWLGNDKPFIIFDEIHKYRTWKNFLKGYYDLTKGEEYITVTGSSRLDVFKHGGDSLMGRYFSYRVHPFSVAELTSAQLRNTEIADPKKIADEDFSALLEFGGFPEPFLKQDKQFSQRWKTLRQQQLFREDIRDLSHIQEIAQLELLAELIKHQTGQIVNRSNLATKINVSVRTIQRWLEALENFYYCFTVKPWSKNITRSLIKEPKIYLWDWSNVDDPGARAENFVASQLLKAVNFWTDCGLGNYGLYYIRDKEQREVDFVVTKNDEAWFLVEVKSSVSATLNKNLSRFQEQTQAQHAFQIALDADYIDADCFARNKPIIVPAKTFLSQLV